MDKQRILKEAQKIAKKFTFWMVSGNIAHLYGYIYETPEENYELEIKFDENFPNKPPQFLYHDEIKELLGDFQLNKLENWTPDSAVVEILHELSIKVQKALKSPQKIEEEQLIPIHDNKKAQKLEELVQGTEEFITPDLNTYPPDFQLNKDIAPFYSNNKNSEHPRPTSFEDSKIEPFKSSEMQIVEDFEESSVMINTELGLIQQEYAYDQKGKNRADIIVYITITLTKTFIINIDFTKFPERPFLSFPDEVKKLIGPPNESLDTLINWNHKNPCHIVEILRELEKKLFFIKEIESQLRKVLSEYQSDMVAGSSTQLNVRLLTYGFKEYTMVIDLEAYPKLPKIDLSHELKDIIRIPIIQLNAYKNWKENVSEPIELIREISWLVDKNSRVNFEIDLLKEHYQNIKYDPLTEIINMEMKGKMKTEDITFQFQIQLPKEYPLKLPEVKVINEFELDSHEKIKQDLHTSFKNFFNEWTPFSYLIDLFNLISKKIFEVSVVSCVICHKIECPTCGIKIAASGEKEPCYIPCPHCDRAYHNHCWEQTIRSFGKCGFCLRQP
ncbi:MAG: ubiquitin-conjugating enzyme E2 variant [Promethearchaeota archaeon]